MKNFRNIIFVLVVVIFALQVVISSKDEKKEDGIKKPMVSLSTFSLYDITKHIAKDKVDLVMILPFGVDAHSFEPTPKLMAKIQKSDLVIYSGAGLEPWVDRFDFKHKVVDMSKSVKLLKLDASKHHHTATHNHHNLDPHYWLDVGNMMIATEVIKNELIKISPENKNFYEKNAKKYIDMLKNLDAQYKQVLSQCKVDTIVVNHNAFSYMAKRYGFNVDSVSGFSPQAQPNAKNMMHLVHLVKEHNITTVFFENFANDKAIRSVASEAKVKVDSLQPIGNITADEAKHKYTYEDIMKQNLKKLSKALKCR